MTTIDPRKALEQLRKDAGQGAADEAPLSPVTIIDLEVESEDGRRTYRGRFKFTVPTLGMKIDIGKLKTLYLPMGSHADVEAAGIVETIAYLTVCCEAVDEAGKPTKLPGWWDPINARDFTPYGKLYSEAVAYDRRFRGAGKAPQRSRDAGLADEEGPNRGGEDDASDDAVGGDVQAPAERRTTLAASRKRG